MSRVITKIALKNIFAGIIPTFSNSSRILFPDEVELENKFFKGEAEVITLKEMLAIELKESLYFEAIKYRIAVVFLLMEDFLNSQKPTVYQTKTEEIWSLIYNSLIKLNGSDIVATIGSQGFLSIPLYYQDRKDESFEFLRLHIWDESFAEYIDWEKTERFSIHSHQFHAQSRTLIGQIENRRYNVRESSMPTENCFFRIEWNNLEDVNQKSSNAVNTGRFVLLAPEKDEVYQKDDGYEIAAGEFHKSKVQTNTTSTVFLFSSKKGKVEKSFVVGPSDIDMSTVNRKVTINPKPILEKLNQQILNYERAD